MRGITNHEWFLPGKFNFQLQGEERGCSLKPPYKRILKRIYGEITDVKFPCQLISGYDRNNLLQMFEKGRSRILLGGVWWMSKVVSLEVLGVQKKAIKEAEHFMWLMPCVILYNNEWCMIILHSVLIISIKYNFNCIKLLCERFHLLWTFLKCFPDTYIHVHVHVNVY